MFDAEQGDGARRGRSVEALRCSSSSAISVLKPVTRAANVRSG